MTEFMKHIAETEGVRTPDHKRSSAEINEIFEEHKETKAKAKKKRTSAKAEKAAREARSATTSKPAKAKNADAKVEPISIPRFAISTNPGHTSSAGYDEASKTMHVEFTKGNVYQYTEIEPAEFADWKATFDNAEIVSGNHFRKAFRNRKYSRVNNPAAVTEVK